MANSTVPTPTRLPAKRRSRSCFTAKR